MSQTELAHEKHRRSTLRAGRRPSLLVISFGVGAVYALVVGLLAVTLFIPNQVEDVRERVNATAHLSLTRLSEVIVDPILARDYEYLYTQLDRILNSDPTWKRLRITSEDGTQIYPLTPWQDELDKNTVLLSHSVGDQNAPIATIEIVVDQTAEVAERISVISFAAMTLILILALIILVTVFFLQTAIAEPIREITKAFRQMATGDFDYPLPNALSREVSYLLAEFSRFRRATYGHQENLVQVKEEAERANKAKSRFLSRMSHELRTPLNSVLGFSEMALHESKLGPEQRRRLEAINQSGHHLLDLVNEILDLARLESGKLEVKLQPVYLPDILDHCESMTTHFARSHDVTLTLLPIDGHSCCVLADPLRLKQVVINLISNAVKYNRKGGRVYIEVETETDGMISIRVRDTGIGFSHEEGEKIFAPFERLSKTAASVDGTGIGLSISKRIVDLMGGTISAHSVEGVGSEFSIKLKAAVITDVDTGEFIATACGNRESQNDTKDEQENVETDSSTEATESTVPALTILVAEDNQINQLLIQSQLEALGHQCVLAANGKEALEKLEQESFDLLLTDISMPEMDGLELTQYIRKGDSALGSDGAKLPIIACSANAMESDQASGFNSGVDAYLTKPFKQEQLADAIANALNCRATASVATA